MARTARQQTRHADPARTRAPRTLARRSAGMGAVGDARQPRLRSGRPARAGPYTARVGQRRAAENADHRYADSRDHRTLSMGRPFGYASGGTGRAGHRRSAHLARVYEYALASRDLVPGA